MITPQQFSVTVPIKFQSPNIASSGNKNRASPKSSYIQATKPKTRAGKNQSGKKILEPR